MTYLIKSSKPIFDGAKFKTQKELYNVVKKESYYCEFFEDRGLIWETETDSIDDDGAKAIATITWNHK